MGGTLKRMVFQPPLHPTYEADSRDLVWLRTRGQESIPAFFIDRGADLTVLFSHGNAEDIGMMLDYFREVSALWRCNFFVYEYVGTGACCHLGSHFPMGGLILQSPLLSVHRVAFRLRFSLPGDMFCNIDKIGKVQVPVFIIHGTHDEVVPVHHGLELYRKCKSSVTPYWVEGGGHNNLELLGKKQFYANVSRFLRLIRSAKPKEGEEKEGDGGEPAASAAAAAGEAEAAEAGVWE